MRALSNLGSKVFPKSPERLFIHQFGDGFIIVSDFPEESPTRPIAICLAVMRHLLNMGIVTKAAISGGRFSDVTGCYPESVLAKSDDFGRIPIGAGIMTITKVTGTALIAAYKLASLRKGAVLLIDPNAFEFVPDGVTLQVGSPTTLDWIHLNHVEVTEICERGGLHKVEACEAEEGLRNYINKHKTELSEEWIASTLENNNMPRSLITPH